jgi:hypothetical protein
MSSDSKLSNNELGRLHDGDTALANWITRDPEHDETFIFHRFNRLAARSILHLKAHLITLENEVDQMDEEARESVDLDARQSSRR